jgi:uncharacterized membrane protein (UPF0136 family)
MVDFLYSLAQVLCVLGLAWGAILAISTSETLIALGQARFEHRVRTRRARRHPTGEDPHLSRLGYWR